MRKFLLYDFCCVMAVAVIAAPTANEDFVVSEVSNALAQAMAFSKTNGVQSVNGKKGAVYLSARDVGAFPSDDVSGNRGQYESVMMDGERWSFVDSDFNPFFEIGLNGIRATAFYDWGWNPYPTLDDVKRLVENASGAENDFHDWRTNDTVALGANAATIARGAVQIGEGNNTVANTLKFRGTTVVDSSGRVPVASLAESVGVGLNALNVWQAYWSGDDVRVTVTNYYGSAGMPRLYFEEKMPADENHPEPWFKVVWDEMTRWTAFLAGYNDFTNDVAMNKADRAWGAYDSSTGIDSPEGLLQISDEQIMIASGLAYQKTVTTGGCTVWVLTATDPTTVGGVTSNGFFRIEDGDGNALFEIVKGGKRVVGATATDISMVDGAMVITYPVASEDHPQIEVCTNLKAKDWAVESGGVVGDFASVSWSVSSGAWVATVTPNGPRPSMFAKATFETGGNTYIRNNVATSIDKVVIGGREYTVTVETVNGKQLMVLH